MRYINSSKLYIMKKTLLILSILIHSLLFSQEVLRGIVLDEQQNPLPFANVYTDSKHGTMTTVDGEFTLNLKEKPSVLYVSYVGFKTQKTTKFDKNYLTITLEAKANKLAEVVLIAKENPALKYIKGAIANRKENDIKSLDYYNYDSYEKLVVTANPDSIQSSIDTVYIKNKEGKRVMHLDSTNYELKKTLIRSHFYMTEKASEIKYKRHVGRKETVLATHMAGFKQPIYELFALKFQDFSFYEDTYTIMGADYINPITNKGLKTYNYKILDTLISSKDSVFLIHFKQKATIKTKGIEGLLYLENKEFALTKVLAELKGAINIKAKQDFAYHPNEQIWFPENMELLIKKGEGAGESNFFGGMVRVGSNNTNTAKKDSTLIKHNELLNKNQQAMYLSIKTNNFNIKLNEPLKVKNVSSAIEFDDNSANRTAAFWNKYRTDSITLRGKETYVVMDSLVKEEGIEKKINQGRKLLHGYFPTKYIDININKLFNYNRYEGFRLGIGGKTNENISRKYVADAYAAYGFGNKKFNYHGGLSVRLNKNTNTWFGVNYTDDVYAINSSVFITDKEQLFVQDLSFLNNQFFYNNRTTSAYIKHDLRSNVATRLQIDYNKIENTIPYVYNSATTHVLGEYDLTLAKLGIQWNPFATYMNTPNGKITLQNAYPKITVQLTKSLGNSDFDFGKFEIKMLERLSTGLGNTDFTFMMGVSQGELPITHLFGGRGNVGVGRKFPSSFNIAGLSKFETMENAQFFADQYAFFQIRHSLKKVKISKHIHFSPSIIYRFILGDINDIANHSTTLTMRSVSNGFSEAGLELNNIFSGLGLGMYHRLGASKTPVFEENFALKMTYRLRF